MLCEKFEFISIKIGFLEIFKVAEKSGQRPCTIYSTGSLAKNDKVRILHFYNFF